MELALTEIIERLLESTNPDRAYLNKLKSDIARKYNLNRIPGNSELIKLITPDFKDRLLPILRRKETRSISGVNIVAVMTKPYPCPHGKCAYCPGGPEKGTPQSYTGYEPAAMRGIQNNYNPHLQVTNRIKQMRAIGHCVDKVELIIMGGTFPKTPKNYQTEFIIGCLDAITGQNSRSLEEAKIHAEKSDVSNVGITVETRPDCVNPEDVDSMLYLGVTRVELGVQTIYDDIYEHLSRGHRVEDVFKATKVMKDSALKICYHMMPGLPNTTTKMDLEAFKTIFTDSQFKPDMIKIYPTLVVKGTKLFNWWRKGEYSPLNTEETIELISKVKEIVPPWVRIMRIQRDIPLHQIEAGVDRGNLRQLVKNHMMESGKECNCIRCREIGHRAMEGLKTEKDTPKLIHRIYDASNGIEDFISFEFNDIDAIIGFLRLRIPSEPHRPEINNRTGLVRELHIYGRMTPVGDNIKESYQHYGWGKALMDEAERTASENYDVEKMIVMSALGTKEYYSKLGYKKDGVYVSKSIS